MRIRTISVALGLSAVVVLTLVLAGLGQDTARGTGTSPFGDGSDGVKVYSVNETDAPKDAVVDSGTASSTTLVVSSVGAGFVSGEKILIHQTRGSGAGSWELNEVQNYALGNITTVAPLENSYLTSGSSSRAQVLVLPEYTNVTLDPGVIVSAKEWDGSVGGLFAFLASGTVSVNGTISANGTGNRGGGGSMIGNNGCQGEGWPGIGTCSTQPNENGGGGGNETNMQGGGGGGHGTEGQDGKSNGVEVGAFGGLTVGTPEVTEMFFGGAGGGSGGSGCGGPRAGGDGGGIVVLLGASVQMAATGAISAGGADGNGQGDHGSGAGAGGSVLIRTADATFGTGLITATGGTGGLDHGCTCCDSEDGGNGGDGRIRVEYCDSISGGTADPPASAAQISCKPPVVEPKEISITNVFQDPLPKTCFDVMDSGQSFLFSVCDNDFQNGFPVSHAACDDGSDIVCNDEDPALGSIRVTVDAGIYHVEVGKTPLNITADATKAVCSGGPTCSLTFTNTSGARPWFPWDVAGPNSSWPPDGVVDLANDILGVIQHDNQTKP